MPGCLNSLEKPKKSILSGGIEESEACSRTKAISSSLKKVRGIMERNKLTVPKNLRLKAKRTISTRKPRPNKPNQWWGIDMTKVFVNGHGWQYLVIVIDWYTKKVVGYNLDHKATTDDWLAALYQAVNTSVSRWYQRNGNFSLIDE